MNHAMAKKGVQQVTMAHNTEQAVPLSWNHKTYSDKQTTIHDVEWSSHLKKIDSKKKTAQAHLSRYCLAYAFNPPFHRV